MILTISGPPGSGKTTVARLIAERTGRELILTGQIFRALAIERGLDLAAFGELARTDRTIDEELDRRQVEAMADWTVVEGRLAGVMARRAGKLAFTIYIGAPATVRAARIANREGGEVNTHLEAMNGRHELERTRYQEIYGIDPDDAQHYDLVIDTAMLTAEQATDRILETLGED